MRAWKKKVSPPPFRRRRRRSSKKQKVLSFSLSLSTTHACPRICDAPLEKLSVKLIWSFPK